MFVYCLVLVSVVQVVWTQSLQEMHRTEPLYFLLFVMHWEQMGRRCFQRRCVGSRVALNVSGECNEEKYDCRRVISP